MRLFGRVRIFVKRRRFRIAEIRLNLHEVWGGGLMPDRPEKRREGRDLRRGDGYLAMPGPRTRQPVGVMRISSSMRMPRMSR